MSFEQNTIYVDEAWDDDTFTIDTDFLEGHLDDDIIGDIESALSNSNQAIDLKFDVEEFTQVWWIEIEEWSEAHRWLKNLAQENANKANQAIKDYANGKITQKYQLMNAIHWVSNGICSSWWDTTTDEQMIAKLQQKAWTSMNTYV